ncbi:MAG: lactate/malate family dehydrogenase, partial [Brevinema sp.]
MPIKPIKIAVIGAGKVGTACAHVFVNLGLCQELLLVDILTERTLGEVWDLEQGGIFATHDIRVRAGSYADCGDADIIVFSACESYEIGSSRLSALEANCRTADAVLAGVLPSGFKGIFIVISNPVDLIAHYIYKKSGFPSNRVIGTGTIMETMRLQWFLSKDLGVSPKSIEGFVLGEHGDNLVPIWSGMRIAGTPYLQLRKDNPLACKKSLEEIQTDVARAGWEIYDRKGTTWYGIAGAAGRIVKAITDDAKV